VKSDLTKKEKLTVAFLFFFVVNAYRSLWQLAMSQRHACRGAIKTRLRFFDQNAL
jgi:hypothetical protein